ncbi:uncharacterized protein LOC144770692 [Lissotriton helveticus]
MEAVVQKMAESQEMLGKLMEKFLKTAEEDRGQLHDVLKGQGDAHDQAMGKLTDVLGQQQQRPITSLPSVILQKYVPGDDPDYFFTNFERLAQAASWPADRWGQYLGPLLTGDLQAAYQQANIQGNTPYDDIKKCILERLGIDDETYRVKLRQAKEGPQETPRALSFRIKDLANRWLRPDNSTKDDILAKIYLEQFLASLHPATQKWVRQHARLTLDSAVEIASAYSRAQETSRGRDDHPHRAHINAVRPQRPPPPRKTEPPSLLPPPLIYRPPNPGPQCYNCGGYGHIARVCPQKDEPMEIGLVQNYVCATPGGKPPPFRCPVYVDGHPLLALADTGCRQSVLRPQDLPTPPRPPTGTVAIQCVHGDTKKYPTTQVRVRHPADPGTELTVGLIPNLPEQVILGSDYAGLPKLVQDTTDSLNQWWGEAPFSGEQPLAEDPTKARKSRNQKRQEKRNHTTAYPVVPDVHPWQTDREFRASQQEDPVLQEAWGKALDQEDPLHDPIRNGGNTEALPPDPGSTSPSRDRDTRNAGTRKQSDVGLSLWQETPTGEAKETATEEEEDWSEDWWSPPEVAGERPQLNLESCGGAGE